MFSWFLATPNLGVSPLSLTSWYGGAGRFHLHTSVSLCGLSSPCFHHCLNCGHFQDPSPPHSALTSTLQCDSLSHQHLKPVTFRVGLLVSFRDPSLPSPAQPGILSPVTPQPSTAPAPPLTSLKRSFLAKVSKALLCPDPVPGRGLSLRVEATGLPPPLLQVFALVPSPLSPGAYLLTCYVKSQCLVRGVCLCPLPGHWLAVLRVASPCSWCSLSPRRSPGGTAGGGGVCGTRVTCSILPACLLSGDFLQRTLSVPPTVKVVWF